MDNTKSTRDELINVVSKLTEREVAVALAILQQSTSSIAIVRNRDYIFRAIEQVYFSEDSLLDLLKDIRSVLLSQKDIEWITESVRTSLWFSHYYNNKLSTVIPFRNNSVSIYIDNLITGIDCYFHLLSQNIQMNLILDPNGATKPRLINSFDFGLPDKINAINDAKALYNSIRTTRKYTDWISINDQDQLYWASDYLRKAGILVENKLFLAQNSEDLFAQICASLDTIDSFHNVGHQLPTTNKKYFISNMRKAWSQKKFRDKKDIEAAQDLLLTRKAKKQLSELSSAYGISSVEILTDLIDTAYQNAKN
ncbi:hypothetical protein [Psychrobacter sp.]|uniref:hypothetical protein n=1 Tax=Psychrobacter sp. TaxID=56811 RepID=UPI00356A0FC4